MGQLSCLQSWCLTWKLAHTVQQVQTQAAAVPCCKGCPADALLLDAILASAIKALLFMFLYNAAARELESWTKQEMIQLAAKLKAVVQSCSNHQQQINLQVSCWPHVLHAVGNRQQSSYYRALPYCHTSVGTHCECITNPGHCTRHMSSINLSKLLLHLHSACNPMVVCTCLLVLLCALPDGSAAAAVGQHKCCY